MILCHDLNLIYFTVYSFIYRLHCDVSRSRTHTLTYARTNTRTRARALYKLTRQWWSDVASRAFEQTHQDECVR